MLNKPLYSIEKDPQTSWQNFGRLTGFLGLIFLLLVVVSLQTFVLLPYTTFDRWFAVGAFMFCYIALGFFIYFLYHQTRPDVHYQLFTYRHLIKHIITGVIVLLLINMFFNIFRYLFQLSEPANQLEIDKLFNNSVPMHFMLIIYMLALAPVVEEGLFRGLIGNWFDADYQYIISFIAFGLIHVGLPVDGESLLDLIQYGIIGMYLTYLYRQHYNIEEDISVHMANNLIGALVLIFA